MGEVVGLCPHGSARRGINPDTDFARYSLFASFAQIRSLGERLDPGRWRAVFGKPPEETTGHRFLFDAE